MKRLENKVAVITGAAAGLGKQIAILFASEGAKVVATDINAEELSKLEETVSAKNGVIHIITSDISDSDSVEEMIAETEKLHGRIDILVNNAGIMDDFTPVDKLENQLWDKVMAVNLNGPFYATRSVLKRMLKDGGGVIVNIASIAGMTGAMSGTAYTVSKHGLIGLTQNTGYVYAKHGIRCNAIAPGAMKTGIGDAAKAMEEFPEVGKILKEQGDLNPRTAEPVEVARVALFLASDDSSFVNGEVLVADGGWTASN